MSKELLDAFEKLKNSISDESIKNQLSLIEEKYVSEFNRIKTIEELASVGFCFECGSHDLNRDLSLISDTLNNWLLKPFNNSELEKIIPKMNFILSSFQGKQFLCSSAKNMEKIVIHNSILQSMKIYKRVFEKFNIKVTIKTVGSELIVETYPAIIFQVILNLFDNAAYWLEKINKNRKITILLDGDNKTILLSDNGPGIDPLDKPYIFKSFFTGKKEKSRGMGLYLSRQLLLRHDFSITLIDKKPGATFLITFK